MKKITFNVFFALALFFAANSEAQCLEASEGLYPAATFTPATCDGITVNTITGLAFAGEYSNVNVTSGETYIFQSSIATDFITISSDDGITSASFGVTPLTWVADVTGVVRFYTHVDDLCTESATFRSRSVKCGIAPCALPTIAFAKVSNCPDATFNVTADITNMGSAASITVTDNQAGTPQVANGTGLLIFGPYANGLSITLTAVNDDSAVCTTTSTAQTQAACPPTNDNLANAIAIECGNNYTGNTVAATLDENDAPDGFGADMDAPNVWYSFTGSGFSETVTLNLCNSSYDTSVLVYTGTSGALTLVAGNDDDNTCGVGLTTRSRLNFVSDGSSTYYIAIEGYNVASTGAFTMDVACEGVTPPAVANQTCATALAVEIDNSDVLSDNSFADISPEVPSCDLFGSIQDVWFSFVAPAEGTVDCNLSNGSMTSLNFNVHSGVCGALVAVANTCNANLTAGGTESLTGLVAGETYYVQVWSNFAEQGTFSLRLSNPSLGVGSFDTADFQTYPNPVTDVLNISYNKNIKSISVFNLLGQEVFSKTATTNISQIDLSNLSKGAYMVKVASEDLVKTIKIVKQ